MVDFSIFTHITWRDVIDIILITVLFYKAIQMLKGTRALTSLLGLGLLMVLYFLSQYMGLYSVHWLLDHIFGSLFIVVVILFQKDIRTALGDMGARYFGKRSALRNDVAEELVNACADMARLHVGALIVVERAIPLRDMVTHDGVVVDAKLSRKLLMSIFYPKAPLHDGAVIISKGRISAAACILPLAVAQGRNFGTRHRAALGISEESDALAIIISEERGEIAVALGGELRMNIDDIQLKQVIHEAL